MNPSHVLDFANYKLEELQKRYIDSSTKYDKMALAYNALPFYKRFFASHPDCSEWDFHFFQYWIEELKSIKIEALYKTKMQYDKMDMPSDWCKSFYKWADSNGIPY